MTLYLELLPMPLANYLHPTSSEISHPILRKWEFRHKTPGVIRIQCKFWRERDGLTFRPAELFVHFVDAAGKDQAELDSQLWDRRLDEWLIAKAARAESVPNEIERFGYALHERFAEAIKQVGDGYFNVVLADLLRHNELGKLPAVADKLKYASANAPYESRDKEQCKAMVDEAIKSVGRDLTERLKYEDGDATKILEGALAYDLDERFGIENGKMLKLW